MHAITINEKRTIERLTNAQMPISIIPNTVSININEDENVKYRTLKKDILFLGRIDRVKGVDILVKAFIHANISKEWRLIIAGPIADKAFKKEIDDTIKNFRSESIIFAGPVFDDKKNDLLKSSWVLAAPSYTEMMGLVNLEAAIYELPSITTYNTGLHDWEQGGGILSMPSVESLKDAIEEVTKWSKDRRYEKGILSKNLVDKKYSNKSVLGKWLALYNKLF